MKEKELRELAILEIQKHDAESLIWYPKNFGRNFYNQDVFGIFDLVEVDHLGIVTFYQISTVQHKSERKKKMLDVLRWYPIGRAWLWCYNKEKIDWVKEQI